MMKFNIIEQNFFENIDIFGIGINIRFNKKAEHRTKIGGLITIIIVFLMAYQVKLVFDNLTDSKNPTVLFEQRYTKSPERYDLSPDKFSFMFGLQDPKSQHFMDPTIYKVTLWSKKTQKILDPKTGDYLTQWNNRIIKTEPCTKQHFQGGAQEYFLKLKFSSMYCISLDEKEIYIEGQFDAMAYSGIEVIVESCSGSTCKSPDLIQNSLNNGRLAIYYTDNAVVPSDKESPFLPIGRQSFWVSGTQFTKSLNISVRNSYLQTDVGFLNQDIKEQRTLTWSFDREQTIPKVGNILYDCYFSFEKNINSVYKRSYVKFDRAVSQIGGAFNVLFALGCLFCRPLSQLELNRKLINSLFNFEEDENSEEKKTKDNENQNQNNNQQQDSIAQDEVKEEKSPHHNNSCGNIRPTSNSIKHSFNMQSNYFKTLNNSQNCKLTESIHQERSKQISKSKSRKSDPMKQSEQSNQQTKELESFFKQRNTKMEFNGYEYFINFFKFSDICRNRKQRLLQKGVDKLYNHIDIFYLINKLLEVEKLKHLLLNEDQIKLFEFIPKPTLCMSDNRPQSISDKVGILYENNKSLVQKTADAHESFKKIIKKGESVSKIDVRLLELLDLRFKKFLQQLENGQGTPDTNMSKLIQNALDSKRKIRLQAVDDDPILKIAMESSTNENNYQTTLSDSVGRIMFNYKSKEPNRNEIYKLDQC